ncbi:CapA family protein [Candidatus Bathycorpusculum sp.]|uniref:CapA family protein n=1 Tax=Candidatus Bathycorpusculum sp. TaxID=2994959 RepID=UPI0028346D2C|nr:CapA family protein [Candidatus Termitimicrobium sp.]
MNITNTLKKIYFIFVQRTEEISVINTTNADGVRRTDERIFKSLNIKKKVQKYIAHRYPTRSITYALLIAILFAALFTYANLPDTRSTQNTSYESLFAHTNPDAGSVFTAAFVGDIMLGRSLQDASDFYGYESYFKKTSDYFKGVDLVLGNFENPIINDDKEFIATQKSILLSANSNCLEAIKNAGFNMLSLANNHMMDYGVTGMLNTLESLDRAGVAHFGAGRDVNEAKSYQLIDSNGTKIAVLGINAVSMQGFASKNTPGILATHTSETAYLDAVSDAASAANVVIVFIHWGDEYTTIVSSNQREIGRKLIDAGADIVIGSHPHILQPIEIYENGIIFYSLGNFIFDQGWSRTKDSCIVRYCLDENGQGVFELIPLRIKNGSPAETDNTIFTKRIFHTLMKNLPSENYFIYNNRLYIIHPC